ncbi:MAG: thioredoxin family protein [Chloroflexi bacterium]|nr:thioredoxin family protein [Chloroflexota bacterium]
MKDFAKLVTYAREELGAVHEYERYRPNHFTLRRIAELLPSAHVEIVGASWCKDCKREVPRFAAIAERLHGWTVELLGDDRATRERLAIERIPTFIVRAAAGGKELGRIVESPAGASLEDDLLAIAEAHPSQILA